MTDDKPAGVGGGVQPAPVAEPVSLAAEAEARRSASSVHNPVDELRDHIRAFINVSGLPKHHLMMARSKCDELIYWLRAGAGREG